MCKIESFVIRVDLLSITFARSQKPSLRLKPFTRESHLVCSNLIHGKITSTILFLESTPGYDGDGKNLVQSIDSGYDSDSKVDGHSKSDENRNEYGNNDEYENPGHNAKPGDNTTLVIPVYSKHSGNSQNNADSHDPEPFGPRRSLIITKIKNYTTTKPLPLQFIFWNKWNFTYFIQRDQGDYDGSWAISTIEVISDRLSVARKKNELKNSTEGEDVINNRVSEPVCLSSKHVILCNTANGNQGCQGGFPDEAWNFLHETG